MLSDKVLVGNGLVLLAQKWFAHSPCSGKNRQSRSCFEMVPEFYYADFPRQFRLRKGERSSGYVTDDEEENSRKGRVIKERNYFKTASKWNIK